MNLTETIEKLNEKENKLLLIIGEPGSGKSKMIREYSQETGIPIIDLDKIFVNTASDQLMNEMKNFLTTYHQKVLLLDNKKILYAKNSEIDLMAFLTEISKDIPVVATWNGKIEDGQVYHIRKENEDH
ncbi:MAG: BREX-3 system P-loop-containing protein BrxF, partial [Faecalibacillus sp.]